MSGEAYEQGAEPLTWDPAWALRTVDRVEQDLAALAALSEADPADVDGLQAFVDHLGHRLDEASLAAGKVSVEQAVKVDAGAQAPAAERLPYEKAAGAAVARGTASMPAPTPPVPLRTPNATKATTKPVDASPSATGVSRPEAPRLERYLTIRDGRLFYGEDEVSASPVAIMVLEVLRVHRHTMEPRRVIGVVQAEDAELTYDEVDRAIREVGGESGILASLGLRPFWTDEPVQLPASVKKVRVVGVDPAVFGVGAETGRSASDKGQTADHRNEGQDASTDEAGEDDEVVEIDLGEGLVVVRDRTRTDLLDGGESTGLSSAAARVVEIAFGLRHTHSRVGRGALREALELDDRTLTAALKEANEFLDENALPNPLR